MKNRVFLCSVLQKSTIATFISASGPQEMERQEHLSPTTHTVHSMELCSARQFLLHTYVPLNRTEFVIQAVLPSINAVQSLEGSTCRDGYDRTLRGDFELHQEQQQVQTDHKKLRYRNTKVG